MSIKHYISFLNLPIVVVMLTAWLAVWAPMSVSAEAPSAIEAVSTGSYRVVKGVVTDSVTGEPLPYATIRNVANHRRSTLSDDDGKFSITTRDGESWSVSYAGYSTATFSPKSGRNTVKVKMSPMAADLTEVVVRPGKVKYSKKNNPAVDFVNRLRSESRLHNPASEPYYSYDTYEKTLIGLNDFGSDFSKGFLSKDGKFFENYVDTSTWTGRRLLDLILKEKSATRIMRSSPRADKEVTRGYRNAGLDEVISQENMRLILEDAIREIDIFGNNITVMQNRFVSPLSKIGPDFYKYYLTDTVYVGSDKCIELSFAPHNAESMGFNGKIYVLAGDTAMSVRKVTMRTPHDINLNYVENLFINQSFETDSLGNRHKTYDDVCIELRIAPGIPELYGRKTTVYDNFSYSPREDLSDYYDRLGRYFTLDDYADRNEQFWQSGRMVPLSGAEARMGTMMKEFRKVPVLYWGEKFLSLMESGYVRTGKPSKIDLGPVNTLISHNTVEGFRFRLGAMTMSPLSKRLFAKGYVAYGTKDHKMKYSAQVDWSFVDKKNHSYEWPRHGLSVLYSYDTDMIGQHYLFTNPDNMFLSLKRMESILATYRRHAMLGYVLELNNHFSVEASLNHETQYATPWVPFDFADGRAAASYTQNYAKIQLRWAPGEKFVQGRTQRLPINMDAWVVQLTHEYGPKGLGGAPFELNRTEMMLMKRLWFSAFGYTDIVLKGGAVWSGVWYPSLIWPNANLSYTIQPESFCLMNPMEFASDRYATLDLSYFGNGIIFNRVPLLKRLKLREAFSFKALVGSLSDRNNPEVNRSLPQFPVKANTSQLGKTPYMEIGAGLDNILTFLRVDYVWRLTYLDRPGIDKSGLRVSLHFSF